jgi:hypothetical protein
MNFNPMTWPLAGKLAAAVVAALVAGGSTAAAVASSSPEPGVSTYICSYSSEDLLLQWKDQGGYLSGTYQDARLTGTAPQEQVTSGSGQLSGSISGSGITLNIGFSTPVYGTVNSSSVTLNVPQQDGTIQPVTCPASDLTHWNKAVAALNQQASRDNQVANQQAARAQHDQQVSQAQQDLANAVSRLEGDKSTLNNDTSLSDAVSQMKQDYEQEQSQWQTVQSDSCQNMSYDAGTVGYDAGTVNYDLGTLNYDVTSLQDGDIQAVKKDLSDVSSDLAALQNLGATPGTDSSSAVAAGNKALTSAANAISWAQGQGEIINGEAQQLATTAQNYANSHCG